MRKRDRVSHLIIAWFNLLFGIPVGVWQLVTGHIIVGAFIPLVCGGASLLAFRRVGGTAADG